MDSWFSFGSGFCDFELRRFLFSSFQSHLKLSSGSLQEQSYRNEMLACICIFLKGAGEASFTLGIATLKVCFYYALTNFLKVSKEFSYMIMVNGHLFGIYQNIPVHLGMPQYVGTPPGCYKHD